LHLPPISQFAVDDPERVEGPRTGSDLDAASGDRADGPSSFENGGKPGEEEAGEQGLEVLVAGRDPAGETGGDCGPSGARVAATWALGLSVAAVLAAGLQIASGQREHGFFLLSLTFVVCVAAASADVATRRIPNVLTYPAVLLGLGLNGLLPLLLARLDAGAALVWLGSSGALDCYQGFGLCAVIGIVSFMARGLGGGDVKLLAAVGALVGFDVVVAVLFNTLLVAAVIGLVNWGLKGVLMRRLQLFAQSLYLSAVMRSDMRTVYRFRPTEGPFALSLLIGLILAQFFAVHRMLLNVGW
jgi:Flp pilus assembly protein protease CpaA